MENHNLSELHDAIHSIVRRDSVDPLSRCLLDQLRIVLESLKGWDSLDGLLTEG